MSHPIFSHVKWGMSCGIKSSLWFEFSVSGACIHSSFFLPRGEHCSVNVLLLLLFEYFKGWSSWFVYFWHLHGLITNDNDNKTILLEDNLFKDFKRWQFLLFDIFIFTLANRFLFLFSAPFTKIKHEMQTQDKTPGVSETHSSKLIVD